MSQELLNLSRNPLYTPCTSTCGVAADASYELDFRSRRRSPAIIIEHAAKQTWLLALAAGQPVPFQTKSIPASG